MNIKINNEPATVAEGTTLAGLAAAHSLPDKGVAVAVNANTGTSGMRRRKSAIRR